MKNTKNNPRPKPDRITLDELAAMTDANEHGAALALIATWCSAQRGVDENASSMFCLLRRTFRLINEYHEAIGHFLPSMLDIRTKCAEVMDDLIADTFCEDVRDAFRAVR